MHIHPYFKRHTRATGSGPWSVPDLCAAYQWPTALAGGGVIAIVELGGGWKASDMTAYFASIHQPVPKIVDVSVDSTKNTPGSDADGEVSLDIQISAAAYFVATGKPAEIRVYWANDIAPAVRAAIKDGCDVCSISWGMDEAGWGVQAAHDMEQAAIEATAAGMVVFAASGDNDSSDGGLSPANVDLPAGCPHIIGCGGTNKARTAETVWNTSPGNPSGDGTGGGYSTLFPMPAWQVANRAPNGIGRMVPDVAANADPNTGYEIYLDGRSQIFGGTSAVAPLYTGLFAAFGKKLGFVSDKLWSHEACFTDITVGDNGMYHSQVGPDPCTGLGVPIGKGLAALFTTVPTPPPTTPPTPTPSPVPPVKVTLNDALDWAESELLHGFMTTARIVALIGRGLNKHWPAKATAPALTAVAAWAVSEIPRAPMARHTAKMFIARGLMKHWPAP